MIPRHLLRALAALGILLSACSTSTFPQPKPSEGTVPPPANLEAGTVTPIPTPLPVRPAYKPGELVDYIAQSGDTLPALAARFNTTIKEIKAANPIIPDDATTMPAGFPMKIPVYYKALWASPFKIIPDSAFVNGPSQIGFNASAFVATQSGWWKYYRAYAGGQYRTGAEIVDFVATNWSVSPRLLLAVLEYKAGALSQTDLPNKTYILDYPQPYYLGAQNLAYLQLVWAANTLNNGFYGWISGDLTEFDLSDGTIIRPDPWENAASVAIQYFFSRTISGSAYETAVGPNGFAKTYQSLFGDPWPGNTNLIPGSLRQPELILPFQGGQTWSLTGGPHTGYGTGQPFAALDFAPPSEHHGCFAPESTDYALAMADGLVVRSGPDGVVVDLDGDGDERTGWVLFYLHLSAASRLPAGTEVHKGDLLGYPSCQGGEATGTHVHIARKYNGEWVSADGPLAFDLEGWIAHNGKAAYLGTLTRNGITVTACQCSDIYTQIKADLAP